MNPTNELRFVERQVQHTYATTITVRVLQQKWVRNDLELMAESRKPKFEWRDVPCVKEEV